MSDLGNTAMQSNRCGLILQIDGPGGVRTESFPEGESLIIGSGPEAKIRLNDPGVSSLHLLLKRDHEGGIRAIDLGSETGTRLDGILLKAPAELSPGAELRLASTRIRIDFEGSQPSAPVLQFPLPVERVVAAKAKAESAPKLAAMPLEDRLPAELRPSEALSVLQVAQMWGDTALNLQQFGQGEAVTVGAAGRNNFQVFSPSTAETFRLAYAVGTKIRLQLPPEAGLVVSANGTQKSKDQLDLEGRLVPVVGSHSILSFELGLHEAAQVTFGNVAFVIRFVRPATLVKPAGLEESDYRFAKIAALCLLAFIALITGVVLTTPELRPLDEARRNAEKYVRFLVRPAERAKADKKGSPGAKASDKEGKFGKQEAKKDQAEPSRKGAPVLDPNKREEDRRKVMSAGLLGALKGHTVASNIFGPGGLGTGVNNALGGLRNGAGMGNAQGVGGLGSRGSGPGGGGIGLGMGGLGTKGLGTGGGGGYGSLDLGNRTKESTRIIPGKTIVIGGLSKDVIARVIRSHQHEIKYCYEVELQKNPSLSGKVAVMFTIDATGAVSENKISDTSLHNGTTEQCMLARIQRWRFPEPEGGGEVNVTFPWFFKPAGVDAKSEQG